MKCQAWQNKILSNKLKQPSNHILSNIFFFALSLSHDSFLRLKLQKQKTKQTKKPKKKIMSSKTSQKPEFRYNLPCTSCNDENCYYNKTAPKNLEECQIFLKQIMTRRKK